MALCGAMRVADLDIVTRQRHQSVDVRIAQRIVESEDGSDLRSAHDQ
jgi:hypothetical protein